MYLFQNRYKSFLATQLLVQFPFTPQEQRYQTTISTDSEIIANGWALGVDYVLDNGIRLNGNISYNELGSTDVTPGFLTEFNTPDYRLNLGVGHRKISENLGFQANWRWQNRFVWESKFGVGDIPAYSTLDIQLTYKVKKWHSQFRLGASNVLNQYYTTGFGNPSIGGLYYVAWMFDEFLN